MSGVYVEDAVISVFIGLLLIMFFMTHHSNMTVIMIVSKQCDGKNKIIPIEYSQMR